MKYFIVITLCFFTSINVVSAQDYYSNILDIPVVVDGQPLTKAFTGGMNNPQPNEVDLNQDGLEDLFIFDRTGNVSLTFIKELTEEGFRYRYEPSYARYFPENLSNWVILRDFNGDGIMDLFTHAFKYHAVNGVVVYTGYYTEGRIAFERLEFDYEIDVIPIPSLNNTQTQLYVSNVDYPAIDDLDCDGDLDILTFNVAGGYIELYTNFSIEEGYGRDSLIFERTESCWGGVFETSIDPEVLLSDTPGDCVNLFGEDTPIEERHPGSTLLTFDNDNDGDKDLLLADISYSTINLLENGGTCEEAWITDQDANFPSYDVPAVIPVFPVTFYVDVNNDDVEDLLVAPNPVNGAENYNVLWYYQNMGTVDEPVFEFRQKDLLVEDMLDFGTGSAPAFFDYNADGLLDLVVGTDGYFQPFGERDSRLFLFENTGTASSPAFELVEEDWLGLSAFDAFYSFTPAFGDLDNDGDLDILVGESTGRLFYAENTAGAGNTASFGNWQYEYEGIDVGTFSAPFIVDLDRDGLSDLVIGENTGNINFFRNIGTESQADFNPDPQESPNIFALGNINISVPGSTIGNGAPIVLDQQGTYVLFVGTENRGIELYNNVEGNIDGAFNLNATQLGNIRVGERTRPAIADLDNDGKLEMIVGNERGGLNAFQTDLYLDSTSPVVEENRVQFQLYPNPANERVNLEFAQPVNGRVALYSSTGQLLQTDSCLGISHQLDVANLPAGVYFLEVISDEATAVKRLLIR